MADGRDPLREDLGFPVAMKHRRRRLLMMAGGFGIALVVLVGFLAYRDGRYGQRVSASRMLQHDRDFDFSAPPCAAADEPPAADVRVAYLGVGGFLVEWRGATLVSAPYFTRQRPLEVAFGGLRVDVEAMMREIAGFRAQDWDTLLSGHAHYDHLADVPELMLHHATGADLWTNRSGVRMLHAFEPLRSRIHAVEDSLGSWIRPVDGEGRPLPYRIAPLASDHSTHLYGYRFAHGEVREEWNSFEDHRVRAMRDGQTVAFLVDLLDESDRPVFRIYAADAAAPGGQGRPPVEWIEEFEVDLAVLCVPPHWHVEDYPEDILTATRAAYVIAAHYEDFFQPMDRPLRFIRSLTDARLDDFLAKVERLTAGRAGVTPTRTLCGPQGERWAMPLPGEWIGFEVTRGAVLDSGG